MITRNHNQVDVKENNNTSGYFLVSLPSQIGLTLSQNSMPFAETEVRSTLRKGKSLWRNLNCDTLRIFLRRESIPNQVVI